MSANKKKNKHGDRGPVEDTLTRRAFLKTPETFSGPGSSRKRFRVFHKVVEHFGPEKEGSRKALWGILFSVKWLHRVTIIKEKVIQNENVS